MKTIFLAVALFFALLSLNAQAVVIISQAKMLNQSTVEISYYSSGSNSSARIGCVHCQIGIYGRNSYESEARPLRNNTMTTNGTWVNGYDNFTRRYPASGTFTASVTSSPTSWTICYGATDGGYGFFNQPGTSCVVATPAPDPTSCSFTGTPNIDHGTLTADQVNGRQNSVSISINCNRATYASIANLGGTINLGKGVTSTLTFNGRSSGTIYLPAGNSTHTVTSTLRASSPSPGDLYGSSTIVINLI
ncbi:hypothetical protein QMZ30_24355 [Pantoea sp. EA-12]|uniref:MrpH family fimbial adhesin n=1 Tax=Pantoea sp. EA-12 TaxID=3043303 RepID=UPI0024B5F739|nr:hypothetical protein [Pantoea sp. EA-12]MDI9224055.1 hypothetical protein [Pantoea sp. EA-12]